MTTPIDSALRQGDLVAVHLPPGRGWLSVLRAARDAQAAVLPLDDRLAAPEIRALLRRGRPTAMVDGAGMRRLPGGEPVPPGTALVVATSGTAGRPRLVELGHEAVEHAVRASARSIAATSGDRWLCCIPVAHIGGQLVLQRHLILGAPLSIRRRLTAATLAALPGVRFTSMVPVQLSRLLGAGADLHRLRAILVGGASLDGELAARAARAGVRIVATYGLTETCGGVVYDGRPLPGVEVTSDPAGELLVRGPTLMRGYRRDLDATAGAFTADGWLRTGDAGEVARDGTVHVHGRLDGRIRSGGESIWPAEVEAALGAHPGVAEVLVAGSVDPEWGERVVAYVVPRRSTAPPTLESLRDFAAERIARHKAPRELVIVESLERTALGKLRRDQSAR